MTVDEVNQLIDNEIYENNEGHITGTILSAVLHELNNKKIAVSALDSSFASAFLHSAALAFPIAGLPDNGSEAFASAIFGSAVAMLRNGMMCDNKSEGIAGNIHNLTTAIMNDMGYQYTDQNPYFMMFESAVMKVIKRGNAYNLLKEIYPGVEALSSSFADNFMTAIFYSAMHQLPGANYGLENANIQGFVSAVVDELVRNQIAMQKLSSALNSY